MAACRITIGSHASVLAALHGRGERHRIERGGVGLRIGVLETPVLEEAIDVLSKRRVGGDACFVRHARHRPFPFCGAIGRGGGRPLGWKPSRRLPAPSSRPRHPARSMPPWRNASDARHPRLRREASRAYRDAGQRGVSRSGPSTPRPADRSAPRALRQGESVGRAFPGRSSRRPIRNRCCEPVSPARLPWRPASRGSIRRRGGRGRSRDPRGARSGGGADARVGGIEDDALVLDRLKLNVLE